jgi:hypothetical protein
MEVHEIKGNIGVLKHELETYKKKGSVRCFLYGPIREISVERRGTRVKRFFVSEADKAELKNLTEARQSVTPGDFSGASFWYFLREKVLRVFMDMINKINPYGGGAPYTPFNPQTPTRPSPYPLYQRKQGEGSLAVAARGKVIRHAFIFLSYAMWSTMHSIKENHLYAMYCPIREISVERRGTRVKRFFVSEADKAELENLTEDRRSVTPGDFSGAGFWYSYRNWGLERIFVN